MQTAVLNNGFYRVGGTDEIVCESLLCGVSFELPNHREDNIKIPPIDVKETVFKFVRWIHLAEYRINLRTPQKAGNFLSSYMKMIS